MLKKITLLLFISPIVLAADPSSTTNDDELNMILEGFEDNKQQQEPELDEILQGFEDSSPKTEDEIKDILEGFEDTTPGSEVSAETVIAEARPWDILTLLSLSSSYNYQHEAPAAGETDYRGLSRLKLKIQPELRYQFNRDWDSVISANGFYDFAYRINGRDNYTSQVLDSYESELELREAYLRGTVSDNFDITIGRQIEVWGKADSVRVVDVLNPLDFREPGMVDIEDLRLPTFMIKGDYYFSDWNLSAIVIPEIRMNKNPAYGSDFYLGNPNQPPPDEEIPDDLENQEYALALKGRFQGWDLSFHAAHIFDDQFYFETINGKPVLKHARVNMAGVATNIASGSWILKSEAALFDGIKYSGFDEEYTRADVMLGFDYAGITNTSLSIETVTRYLFDYDKALAAMPNDTSETEGQLFLRYTGTFLREKLEATVLVSFLGHNPDEGAFYRGSIQYELMDAMTILLGGIIYQSGDSRLSKALASNDRIFADWRYSF